MVGIRQVSKLEGDYSGDTHSSGYAVVYKDEVLLLKKYLLNEQLKPNGCQVHNI
jgi:hypothetical protein